MSRKQKKNYLDYVPVCAPEHSWDVNEKNLVVSCGGGTPSGRRWRKDSYGSRNPPTRTYRSEDLAQFKQNSLCGAGSTPHAGGSFFLYEKSVLRESDSLCGREQKVCTDLTPFPALKKMGIQGGPGPLGRARDSVSRPCPYTN